MHRVCIAGLTTEITAVDTAFFERRLRDYADDTSRTPDLRIRCETPDVLVEPAGAVERCRDTLRVVQLPDGRRCRCVYGGKTGRLLQTITVTPDYTEADIGVLRSRAHPTLSLTDFEYMLTGSVFADRVAYLGGLVLHSSALAFDGQGLVFSAPPGTGKSTHSRLWRECYGERVVMVNDDKPTVRFNQDGVPTIYGTPWSGKTDLNNNVSAPLRAVVFLERNTQNTIRQLSPTEALLYMNRELPMPFHDSALGEKLVDSAMRLISSVPVFLLGCTISTEAVETVRTTVGL